MAVPLARAYNHISVVCKRRKPPRTCMCVVITRLVSVHRLKLKASTRTHPIFCMVTAVQCPTLEI